MLPALINRTRRIRQKQRDLCDYGDVDGRRLTKPLSQGKECVALLEHHVMADTDVRRRPPLTLGQRYELQ
jgi:hypothetical protein